MQTIKFLLAIKSVKDQANVKNHNGSTALDVVKDCPNIDEKTMEIRKFLAQPGVLPSKLHLFWNKYFSVGSDWLREVLILDVSHTHTESLSPSLSEPQFDTNHSYRLIQSNINYFFKQLDR